jgi:RND family efflux transporter MFP subunit
MPDETGRTMPRDTTLDREPKPPRRRHRLLGLILLAVLAGAVAVGVSGVLTRRHGEARLASWTTAQATPTVTVALPQRGTKDQELVLPGDVEAFYEASIYARVGGYLKMWYQDIGARVTAGQVLAEIDTPELDQQLEQAKNDLAAAKADAALAELTAKRWKSLLASQAVSRQTSDEKAGDAAAKRAQVAAAQANVDRLEAMESFKRIAAPFDGVVTARETDIGALINAGSGSGAELFKVADLHQMRVYVRVPQAYAGQLRPGLTATLKLSQYPAATFPARLATTSNAIAKASRTLLVELMADNAEGKLWPGTFAEVHFHLPPDAEVFRVPTSALVFRAQGLQLATIGPDGKVVMQPITAGRDLGTEIEVRSGLAPTDRVIDNPPDSLAAGDVVRIAGAPDQQASGQQLAGEGK